jgi:hypothetical protein
MSDEPRMNPLSSETQILENAARYVRDMAVFWGVSEAESARRVRLLLSGDPIDFELFPGGAR